MNPQNRRILVIAAVAFLGAAVGGFLFWRSRTNIPEADVAAFLDGTVGSGRVRFTVVTMTPLPASNGGRQVSVTAKAWPVQPLYTKADTAEYLLRVFQLDADSSAAARTLLTDKATLRNTWLTGGRALPPDPFQLVILQPATQADESFNFQGVLDAHRAGGAWGFSLASGGLEAGGPQGEIRTKFGLPSFVEGDAADEARLRSVVGDFQAFSARVAKVRADNEAARVRVLNGRRDAFLARIAPGQVFAGTVLRTGDQYGTALYLEITAISGNDVTAVLRNEGSWHNGRVFQGSWNADEDFRTTTLTLSSSAGQAVRNAGPFVETTQNWSLALAVDPSGRLSGQDKFFQYQFQPLPPADISSLRKRLEAEFERALAATEPGSLFQGSATSNASGASEPILLRMTGRSDDLMSFSATIEAPTHSWKRSFQGRIIDNAKRSRGEPLRMTTGANDAVVDAPVASILGDPEDLEVSLSPGDGTLSGEDAQFTYHLARAEETDLNRLSAARSERARHFRAVLRKGIAYDGAFREDQGFITHARLEITAIDRETGTIAAEIRSLARPGVFRGFSGTFDPAGGSVALDATSRGSFGEDGSFDVPFLTSATASTVHLELTANGLTGRIEANPHWVMEFPTGSFLSAATESQEPDAPPANGSVFPAFPKQAGAYLLSHGSWSPMPRNNGHVVVETVRPKSELQLPSNIVGAVNEGISALTREKDKQKVTYLVFDGKDPRPESAGPAIVILYVGPRPQGKGELELAPTETYKDGDRRIEIPGNAAKAPVKETDEAADPHAHLAPVAVRIGDQRFAAYVREAGPGYTLFTTTSTLAPGSYVFNADTAYELTQD
jgi:hypothetical protein